MITTQIMRRSVAPVILFAGTVLATLVMAAMPAAAKGPLEKSIEANVSFDFYCGQTRFPAGAYVFEQKTGVGGPVMSVEASDSSVRGLFIGIPEQMSTGSQGSAELRFMRYPDGKSYLREVRNPFASSSSFPMARSERESAAGLASDARSALVVVQASRK